MEIKDSTVHGKGLCVTSAVPHGSVVLREEHPLALADMNNVDDKEVLYTVCWLMTDQLLGKHEELLENSLMKHSALEWDDRDAGVLDYLACKHGTHRNNCYTLYAKVASANTRIRGSDNLHAVYRYSALLNHNCEPNCSIDYEGTELLLTALQDLQPGDELSIDYVQIEFDHDDADLQQQVHTVKAQVLQSLYGFECSCRKCVETGLDIIYRTA